MTGRNTSVSGDGEAQPPPTADGRRGGWNTAPFIITSVSGLTLAGGGWLSNLIVFLINEFNINSISAAQISNVVVGSSNFFPVIAAVLADSFLGCYSVIWISSFISLLGLILQVLTVTVDGLRPLGSATGPSVIQYAVLFTAFALVSIGVGGSRYTLATMGANQFTKPEHQATYFNWFLNRAALKTEGDILLNGSIAKLWKLCSVGQVEELKNVIRLLPLWSSSILLATPIGMLVSLTVLQALTMDRRLGSHFQVPAGSVIVFNMISTSICLSLFDHCLCPLWRKATTGQDPTPLQRIGIGHVLNVAAMAVSALVESKRRGRPTTMSVLWLVPQTAIAGIGEAFHFPGQVGFYYQEFPACLKTMATAMIAMLVGVAFYLSVALIDFVRRVTKWLPDNIDNGRLDNVYWVLVVIGVLNFCYYLVCCWFYEYKSVEVVEEDPSLFHE